MYVLYQFCHITIADIYIRNTVQECIPSMNTIKNIINRLSLCYHGYKTNITLLIHNLSNVNSSDNFNFNNILIFWEM